MIVVNPRPEYFGNMFHDMEEMFGVLQTADTLGQSLADFRVIFMYVDTKNRDSDGFIDLLQLGGQLNDDTFSLGLTVIFMTTAGIQRQEILFKFPVASGCGFWQANI